jgi:DNA polymerase-3 subunit delta
LLAHNPTVTIGAIDQLVEPSPQASAFELLDAVMAGNTAKAAELLARLKAAEDPYKLFGLLVSQVQTLALVIAAQGRPAEAIARESGVHPFVVRKMQPLARSMPYAQLQRVLASVALADMQMKSTGVDPWILLEQCLGKIASMV